VCRRRETFAIDFDCLMDAAVCKRGMQAHRRRAGRTSSVRSTAADACTICRSIDDKRDVKSTLSVWPILVAHSSPTAALPLAPAVDVTQLRRNCLIELR